MFEVANAVSYDINVPFTRESWHGRMKACSGIDASLTDNDIAAWENEHKAYVKTLQEEFDILHFVSVLDLKKRS